MRLLIVFYSADHCLLQRGSHVFFIRESSRSGAVEWGSVKRLREEPSLCPASEFSRLTDGLNGRKIPVTVGFFYRSMIGLDTSFWRTLL